MISNIEKYPLVSWFIQNYFSVVRVNPLTAKLFNLNFHPLEVVSRWRDPQLQVSENYSELTKRWSILFKSCWLMSHFVFTIFEMWYLMCWYKMKTRIYAAPAIKGLRVFYLCGYSDISADFIPDSLFIQGRVTHHVIYCFLVCPPEVIKRTTSFHFHPIKQQ